MTNTLLALLNSFVALLPKEGETVRTGLRGRPAFKCTLDSFVTNYAQRLPNAARALLEATPYDALAMLAQARRELTPDEMDALAKTSDAKFQGLRNGEPIQKESRAVFNIAVQDNETFEQAAAATLDLAISAAQQMAARFGSVHTVNFERWAIVRSARPGSKRADQVPATLNGLPARYQGNFYVSDSPHKAGFLTFAIVHPSGVIERIGKPAVEPEPEVIVPEPTVEPTTEPVAETKNQRDARIKREKRAKAKAEAQTVNA